VRIRAACAGVNLECGDSSPLSFSNDANAASSASPAIAGTGTRVAKHLLMSQPSLAKLISDQADQRTETQNQAPRFRNWLTHGRRNAADGYAASNRTNQVHTIDATSIKL
jgi:hypothetical protein